MLPLIAHVSQYVFPAGTGDSNVVWNVTQCRVAAASHTVSEQPPATISGRMQPADDCNNFSQNLVTSYQNTRPHLSADSKFHQVQMSRTAP